MIDDRKIRQAVQESIQKQKDAEEAAKAAALNSETCAERLQRLIGEKHRDKLAARQAAIETKKLADLASRDVDTEMNQLDAEMNSMTDAELKAQDKDSLQQKLIKAKELEEEKKRRSGG